MSLISTPGCLVLETGELFKGFFLGGENKAGEVVFNTSHSGYEEMASDPSYFNQILVMTAPQQGNYGVDDTVWESDHIHIQGLVCVEMQNSARDSQWGKKLVSYGVPVLSGVDTRSLVLHLRQCGSVWGALVRTDSPRTALKTGRQLIKDKCALPADWPFIIAPNTVQNIKGQNPKGPRIAVLNFGVKSSIIQQLLKFSRQVRVFPPRARAEDILKYRPSGVLLSNGPGDPQHVQEAVQTVKKLLNRVFVFGICMGHQILALALGGRTYKLKFGHRGGNHPVRDNRTGGIFVTSQNHGYAVEETSLPSHAKITYINLNDGTVEGFYSKEKQCMGVQFHPESGPGPHEAQTLFNVFVKEISKTARLKTSQKKRQKNAC